MTPVDIAITATMALAALSQCYRKVGGLHWLRLGRLRLCWCVMRH